MRTDGIRMVSILAVLALMCAGMVCIITDDNSSAEATVHRYNVGDSINFTCGFLYNAVASTQCPIPGCNYSATSGPQSPTIISGTATTDGAYFIKVSGTVTDLIFIRPNPTITSSTSSPLTSFDHLGLSLGSATYTVYVQVGSSFSLDGIEDNEAGRLSEIFPASDYEPYGLTDSNGTLSGTISKAGSLTVTVKNEIWAVGSGLGISDSWTATLNLVFVDSSTIASYDHIITYMDGSSALKEQNQTTTDSGSVTTTILYKPTKDGYTFKGWSMNSDGSAIHYQYGDSVTVPTSGLALYAVWEDDSTPVQTYDHKITFKDGTNTLEEQNNNTTSNGSVDITIDYTPTKDGYTFKGWSKTNGSTTAEYQNGTSVSVSTFGLTLYAVWEKIVTKITVTIDGQSVQMDSDKTVGDLTKPSKDGYVFFGWYSDSEYANELSDDTVLTDGMTVYSWLILSPFENVSIAYMDGTKLLEIQYASRNGDDSVEVVIQYIPTKDGYTFKGWSLDSAATSADYQYGDTVTVTGTNLDLYAVWEVNSTPVTYYDHKITYMDQGQLLHTQNISSADSTVNMIVNNAPTKNGYTFKGWSVSSDGSTVDYLNGASVPVPTSGLTLYAAWEKVIVKITITVDGESIQMDSGSKVSDITEPTKDGYKFIGWYSDEALTKAVAYETVVTDGMTLYSKFSQKTEEDLGAIVLSIMGLIVGLGMMYAGYRNGYTVVLILGLIVVAISGLSIGLEKSGSNLITWFTDLFKGGKL